MLRETFLCARLVVVAVARALTERSSNIESRDVLQLFTEAMIMSSYITRIFPELSSSSSVATRHTMGDCGIRSDCRFRATERKPRANS